MSSTILAPPLAGSVVGSTNDAFVIAEWRYPGGPPGPPRLIAPPHLHRSDDEAWYVLEGSLRVRVGSDEVEAKAGSAVFVPRGTPHTYWNPGARAGSLSIGHDRQYLSFDSGNPQHGRTDSGCLAQRVRKIRFPTARQVTRADVFAVFAARRGHGLEPTNQQE
jgi:hypothetical protein